MLANEEQSSILAAAHDYAFAILTRDTFADQLFSDFLTWCLDHTKEMQGAAISVVNIVGN